MKIEVYNTCIKIIDYKSNDELERYLSVWDKITFTRSWEAFHYDEETGVMTIPKINPYFVQHKLGLDTPIYNFETDEPGKTAVYKIKTKPRNNTQADAIEFLLNERNPRKMICLKPGTGKTYCTINYLSHAKQRSLIVVDQDRIMNQWKESFLEFTDIHESEIYIISGYESIDRMMKEKTDLPYKVFIASHRTLGSFMSKDPHNFTDFVEKYKIGIKVIDEAHVEVKNIVLLDGFSNIAETIYLTATPKRSNYLEDKVYQVIFKNVAKFDSKSNRNVKYHNIVMVSYNSQPSAKEEAMCSSKRGFDLNAYSKYLYENKFELATTLIDKILKLVLEKEGKIAIIIHKLDHITKVKEHLMNYIDESDIGLYCGLVPTKVRSKELDKKIILTTEKGFNKAVDVENLRFLIMTVPISSDVITEQLIGRLRPIEGKNVLFFDVTDEGFKSCKAQRTRRMKTYKNFAKKFINVNI